MLSVQHIYKTFTGPVHALSNVSFNLLPNSLSYLVGHSGAGKTTLFNLINGFEKPSSGNILFKTQNIFNLSNFEAIQYRRNIGVIYQDFRLLPHKNVFENIALPLIVKNESPDFIESKVYDLANRLKIDSCLEAMPEQISGGQKQRAAIARALVHNPELIIADEPTGSLDPENAFEVFYLLHELANRGQTVLIATHNFELIQKYPARLIELRQGQIFKDESTSLCI